MTIWERYAVQASSELVREAVAELDREVKVLRKENADLKSDVERLELVVCDKSTPKK